MKNKIKLKKTFIKEPRKFLPILFISIIASAVLTAVFFLLTFILKLHDDFQSIFVPLKILGVFAFLLLCLLAISLFRSTFESNTREKISFKLFIMIDVIIAIQTILVLVGYKISAYAITFMLVPLMFIALTDRKTAYFVNAVTSIMAFAFVAVILPRKEDVEFIILLGLIGGSILIFFVGSYMPKVKYVFLGFVGVGIAALIGVMISLISGFSKEVLVNIGIATGSELLILLLFMTLLPFFEWAFNIPTDYRLVEITDQNAPLIKRLQKEAPGTFQHSITVANLAEACAHAIGENPFLARAAGYYHDIGKIVNPDYFTENQTGVNIHDSLTPEQSVTIIKKHATDGYAIAKENHIPEKVAITTLEHHGTSVIKYFYDKAKNFTENELPTANYSYSSHKPQTKISAILMIADSAEAVVKSLGGASSEKTEAVVQNIIWDKLHSGQFDECPITIADLDKIKQTLVAMFVGITHTRIKYDNKDKK